MKIAVAGVGYVGLSLAVLLAQNHEVVAINVHQEKTDLINDKKSPIKDAEIEDYLKNKELNLRATTDWHEAILGAKFVVIATPTNYDIEKNCFDTSAVEDIIEKTLTVQKETGQATTMVVKSTIPIGYISDIRKKYNIENIFFSPEFLREGHALYDNLHPTRIIIGDNSVEAHEFANLLVEGSEEKNTTLLFMGQTEAEAVKLFANTYLAMRVAFFNELDIYAEVNNLDTKEIIEGVCLDPRIGNYYNNPSLGFGGYCLPKDSRQLVANYKDVPCALMPAIVKSNEVRKKFIVDRILDRKPKTVGVYRLAMKSGSDNFRASAIIDIMDDIVRAGVNVIIYEPTISGEFFGKKVNNDLSEFKSMSDIIIANRLTEDLADSLEKVYCRDLFTRD